MTHYYNYHYEMPPEIREAWEVNWYDPKVVKWVKTLKKRRCGKHGELGISIGWYGVRAQCLECIAPDEEEEAWMEGELQEIKNRRGVWE